MIPTIPGGRLFGVPLRIGTSWLVVVPLVGWALFLGTPPDSGSLGTRVLVAGGGTLLIFLSVIVHEFGHVLEARRRRVPVGGTFVFLLGGFSEIELDAVPPRVEISVAIAGPLASAALAFLLGGAVVVLPDVGGLARVAGVLVLVNAAVAAFNLLPGLPLDGGRVLRGVLRSAGWSGRRAERAAMRLGLASGVLLTVAGLVAAAAGRAASLIVAPAGMLLVLLGVAAQPARLPGDLEVQPEVD